VATDVVIEMPDRESIIEAVISRKLNEVRYQRVAEWFGYIDDVAALGAPADHEVARISEMRASRDILAHNQGRVSAVYIA